MMSYAVKGDTLIVRLTGELDHHSAGSVRQAIDEVIERNKGVKKLIFDLKDLVFMDSSGIGVVIGRYKRMARRGGTVAVREPGRHVERIFALSGIYQIVQKA